MSSPVLSASKRRAFFLAPILVAGLSLLSCGREVTGPEGGLRAAAFAFDPQMPKAFAVEGSGSVVPFNRVRVTLRDLGGALVDAKIVEFPSDAQSVELSMEVLLPFGTGNEGIPLLLDMQYINAAGDTVFRAGPQSVTAVPTSAGEQPPVVPVEVTYVGTGANAASVVISQQPGTVLSGTSTTFNAAALDGQGQPIANTPIVFSSPDPAHVSITPLGVATWLPVRGPARIVATLPTGVDADTITMTVALPPTQLEIVSGNGQSGNAGQPLENDIMLRVLAADDEPVAGVTVTFTVATGGGSVSEETAVSDDEGFVATEWTLGGAPGVQTLTATFPGLVGGPVTISANSGAGPASTLAIASGDGQQGSPGQALPLPITVRVTDEFGNGVAGITVFWVTLSEIGSVTPTQSTTDATGHASAQWTLGASVGVQQARATVAELEQSVDFTANAVSAGVATWTGAVSNDWNVPGNWDIGAVPSTTDHVVIPNVGQNPYPRLTSSPVLVGSVDVQAGSLWLDGQAMIVAGNFSTSGSGVLVMQEDNAQLHVGGNATFAGGSTSGLLTLGVLAVAGNFTQVGTNSPESFQAGPGLSTLLQAPSPTVSFTDPGAAGQTSRFGDLIWTGNGTLTQQSGISVIGSYATTSTTPITHLGIGGAEGRYFEFSTWVSFAPVTFDNVRVLVRQTSDPQPVSLTNITFQNLPAAATQLTIQHPGGGADVTLDNVAFQVAPATTLLLSVTDTDAGDGQPLVVNVANATPTTPGDGVAAFGGAIVNWPAASQRTWVGSVSSDWHDAANWFPAAVPGTLDEVLIGAASNAPAISAPATIGNLIVTFGGTLTLNAILTVNGDITVDGTVIADPVTSGFRAAGTGRSIRGANIQHVDVRGAYTLSGPLTITSDLFVRGSINPDANPLTIGGNLSLLSAGVLIMQSDEDVVSVGGNAFFTGGATQGLLTNGTLELHGDLTQSNSGTGNPANSFAAAATHVTRLVGSGTQNIDIFNGGHGAGTSHFGTLDLSAQTGTVNFARFNTTYVDGTLIANGSAPGPQITVTSAGTALDAWAVNVSALRVDGLALTVASDGVSSFSGVTFGTYPGNVTQLTVVGPGAASPVVLSGLTFNSVPAANNYYLQAIDSDGATPNPLTVQVVGSTPAAPAATLFNAVNGAVVEWPPNAGVRVWQGGTSINWSDPANWVGNVAPTATDSVHIPGGTTNSPFVDATTEIRTLTLAAGASLTPGFDLTVRGSVDVASGGAIQPSDGRLILSSETGGTISGTLARVMIRGGLFTLDGATVIDGNLDIYGDEFTPGVPVTGDLSIGDFTLTVTGGLFTGMNGRLTMMGTGVMEVQDFVNFFGASTAGRLTNGTLRIGGEFYQDDTESAESFSASGSHLVQFAGTNRIIFQTPQQSHFHNVDFVTPGMTTTFWSDARASGLARILGANITLASNLGAGAGNARRFTADRMEQVGVNNTIRNVGITTGAITAFFGGTLTLTDFDPTIVQIDIQGTSNLLNSAFNAVRFETTPTGAGRYVRIVDTNGTGDGSPNLTVVDPLPATHGGWAEAVAPATMTGWVQNPAVVFTGAVNGDWDTDENWSTGRVPEATDSVIIPVESVVPVTFPGTPRTLRALVIEYPGFLNLATQLTITGTLVAPTAGNFACDGGSIVFAGGTVTPARARGTIACLTRIVQGALIPTANFRIENDLQVEAEGRLFPGRTTVTVTGNFSTLGAATLQMTEPTDSLIVLGGATFGGASTENLLRDGVLVINGNFEQRGPEFDASSASFAASDNHVTVFAGFGFSQVSFETPGNGAGTSHFAHVQAAKGEGGTPVQLNSRVFANGQLRSAGQPSQRFSSARSEGSESFESWGADVENFQFVNVTWRIVDGATVGRMDAITFSGMDLAATQLDIERSSGDITIRGIEFLSPPEQGLYLRAADSNEGDGQSLVITLDSPTPAGHGGRILEEFGARIAGWGIGD